MDQETLKQIRRIIIMLLGVIEDALGIERTIKPHNERRKEKRKNDSIDAT